MCIERQWVDVAVKNQAERISSILWSWQLNTWYGMVWDLTDLIIVTSITPRPCPLSVICSMVNLYNNFKQRNAGWGLGIRLSSSIVKFVQVKITAEWLMQQQHFRHSFLTMFHCIVGLWLLSVQRRPTGSVVKVVSKAKVMRVILFTMNEISR